MKHLSYRISVVFIAAAFLLAFGCSEKSVNPPDGNGQLPDSAVPDFSLTDVNPNSATYNQAVSPRDYAQRISAWYFGHAT